MGNKRHVKERRPRTRWADPQRRRDFEALLKMARKHVKAAHRLFKEKETCNAGDDQRIDSITAAIDECLEQHGVGYAW